MFTFYNLLKKKLKSFRIKIFFILILIIYIIYIFREQLFINSPCSHLYNINSFPTCALSKNICNITILFDSYIAYRNCVIKYSSTQSDYVIFDAVNGLGNRILGLISVTTYALVTNRVLLINWQPGDNHPVYFDDLFLPLSSFEKKIPYQYSLSRLTSLIKNRWINNIELNRYKSQIPQDWAFYFDREILCNKKLYNQSWFQKIGFYILNLFHHHVKWIRTDQYFVPLLTRNGQMRQSFVQIFQNGQIFVELARRLLKPVSKVNLIIEDFQKQYNFEKKNITIGVHMRSWSSNMIDYIEPFQKCIEHVIQNVTRSSKEEIKIYLYIISNTPQRRQKLETQLSKMYKNLEILKAFEPPKNSNVVEKMQYTLAELLILSKMHHLIITSKSTFGMVAQGLAGKGAWIVRQGAINEGQSIKSNLCQWESTSEPEYQMKGSFRDNDSCSQHGAFLPSIGERTIL
ncbi:unnamed protein product [Adineta steineri]|uniref:Uncharacterized protein n=1 Tax=Adineta steineri TaxID=433720 RepID=A0A814WPF6_9BILA|nr:unnamed protein product [Adineta steineri]CAF3661829.1 unnamed protein product [Adineta steineri]